MKKILVLIIYLFTTLTATKAQILDFIVSADTITIGDTLSVLNISTYPQNTIYVWSKGEYCYTSNVTGTIGGEILVNDSLCNDTVVGAVIMKFVFNYAGNKTVTLRVAGTTQILSKQVYVISGGGCFNQCDLSNGNFEQFYQASCPYNGVSGTAFTSWPSGVTGIVDCWNLVPPGTADFYTLACGSTTASNNIYGGSLAYSADSYISLIPYIGTPTGNLTQYREYVTQSLPFTIRPFCSYRVGMYAKIAHGNNFLATGYGNVGLPLQIQLTSQFPSQYTPSSYLLDINAGLTSGLTPAVSDTAWQLIQTTFNSGNTSGNSFLTFGNFFSNSNTQLTDPTKNDAQIYIFLDSLFMQFVDFNASVADVSCLQNGSIYLTPVCGTAPFTFQWSNGATTQNINNLSAGAYTVTATYATGLIFTNSYTVNNNICTPVLTALVTNSCTTACTGQIDLTVTGNCQGPYSFAWSNGSVTEDLTGLCAGTYTVTTTATNGCTATANYTVNSFPPPNIAFNFFPLQCQGTFTLQNPSSGVTYSWDFRDNSGALVYFGYGTTVTLPQGAMPDKLVVSADNNGCKASKTYFLGECCPPDPATNDFAVYGDVTLSQLVALLQANRPTWVYNNTINGQPQQSFCANLPSNLTYYKLNTGLTMNGTNKLFIYGNLTIDKSIDLREFSLVMAADREIVVNNNVNVNLYSDLGVFFNTCGKYMWRGIRLVGVNSRIYANGNVSHLTTAYNYQINDAANGINSTANGKAYISNVLFNRNGNGIIISNSAAASNNSIVTGCLFTSKDNTLSSDQILLENPANNNIAARSNSGINLTRLNNMVIGYDEALAINGTYGNTACGLSNLFNQFENIEYGIWLQRCAGMEAYRNEFKQVVKGIRISGDAASAASITVGKPIVFNLLHNNNFDLFTENGIELVGNASLTASSNFFTNTTYITGSSNKLRADIEFNNAWSASTSSIKLNEFNDYSYAAIYLHNNTSGTMNVDVIANKFRGRLDPATRNPWSVYGIYADAAPSNKYVMNINKNLVLDDTRYGIRIRNNDNASIVGNILTWHMPGNVGFASNAQWVRGIFISNSVGHNVENNQVIWNSHPAAFSTSYPDKVQGIRLEDVTASSNVCNLMDGMGTGVYIQNNNIGTSYTTNVTKNCYNGYKLNNANISPVGSAASSNNNTFSNITSFRVTGTSSTPPKDWYYIGSNDIPVPNNLVILPLSATSALLPCTNFTGEPDSSERQAEGEGLEQVVNGTLEFNVLEDENIYIAEENAYKILKSDSLLRDSIAGAAAFVAGKNIGNMGAYKQTEDALTTGNTPDAVTHLLSITDENLMEENKRVVMEALIKIADSIPLTPADTTALESIAYLPALVGGTAVYMARAILAIEVDDEWLTSSYRMANDKQKATNKNTQDIYPNPARNFIFIKCTGSITYEITDAAGKKYKQGIFDLQGNAVVSVNIEQLVQGVYIVKATQEDCTKIARIVVIK
jgi:hypothetical protein